MNWILGGKAEEINKLARDKIAVFERDIQPDGSTITGNLESLRSLSNHIASDYGDRYLLELIQNAYDAHLASANDGRIKIVLDSEENEHGTLYIANYGQAFRFRNLKSICLIGQSEKPPGENIGNKGLGFRSVTYITDSPEIYSIDQDAGNNFTSGYCFRFATGNDISTWTTNPIVLKSLPNLLPLFSLPLPIQTLPDSVQNLFDEGFVTVIRLELRDQHALQSLYFQLQKIKEPDLSLLLFLGRIASLEAVVKNDLARSFKLTRQVEKTFDNFLHAECTLNIVTINSIEKYIVAKTYIKEEHVKKKIEDSISQKQLHPSWKDWKGDGELALAVRCNAEMGNGRLYTFLPMGETAVSPFKGHLHGSFYPKADRTSLEAGSPLNTMYIEEAMRLSVSAALAVRELADKSDPILDSRQCARAILDLLSWQVVPSIAGYSTSDYAKRIAAAFAAKGSGIGDSEILLLTEGDVLQRWGTPKTTWLWDDSSFTTLSSEKLSKLGNIHILSNGLGLEKVKRFKETWEGYISTALFSPDVKKLGDITEKVAEELLLLKADTEKWTQFYREVYSLTTRFPNLPIATALALKKILLCSGNRLLAGFTPAPTESAEKKKKKRRSVFMVGTVVFSPSDRLIKSGPENLNVQQLFQVPQELEQGFSFLHQKIDWYGVLDDVRLFLEKNKIVRKYDARELITNVSRIQRESTDKQTRRQALLWLFTLYSARGDDLAESLSSADIYVPVGKDGWASARRTFFSRGWGQMGKINSLLDEFVQRGAVFSLEIAGLKKYLIAPLTRKPFSVTKAQSWFTFLKIIGVRTGLHPILLDSKKVSSVSQMSINYIGNLLNLDEETIRVWRSAIGEIHIFYSGANELKENSRFYYWPGQKDFSFFPPEIKKLNARLLLDWIAKTDLTLSDLQITYAHNYYYNAQRYTWPTPFLAYLKQVEWFPIENVVGKEKGAAFKKLHDVWLPEEGGRFRPFLPQIPFDFGIRQALSSEEVLNRLKWWGEVNIVNDSTSIIRQVAMLGQIFKDEQVEDFCKREFLNLYATTWKLAGDSGVSNWNSHKKPDWIVIRNRGVHKAFSVEENLRKVKSNEEEKIYVGDDSKSLVTVLLEELGHNILDFDINSRILRLVRDLLGPLFVATSTLPVEIMLDGVGFDAAKTAKDTLVNMFPAVPALICLAMESLTGTSAQQLPSDRGEIIARLRQVRVMVCHDIAFKIAGNPKPLPISYYGILGHYDKDVPCLIVESGDGGLNWSHMRQASSALCRLISQPDLGAELKNLCFAMERLGVPPNATFSRVDHLDVLCRELGLGKTQAETALAVESGDKRRIEMFLRPLVFYFCGEESFGIFEGIRNQTNTTVDLLHRAEPLFKAANIAFEPILECVKEASSYSFVFSRLQLDFSKFNRSLIATDGEASAIIYPDEHKMIMKEFIEERQDAFVNILQEKYLANFDSEQDLTEFVTLKSELLTIPPDENWLLEYEVPTVDIMMARVDAWLEQKQIQRPEAHNPSLQSWSKTLKVNEKFLKKFVTENTNLVLTWCHHNGRSLHPSWSLGDSASSIRGILDGLGALDFRELDDSLILKWLSKAGVWPEGMPLSLNLSDLGITEDNLRKKQQEETEKKKAEEKNRRSIRIGNQVIDPQDADYDALSDLLKRALSKGIKNISLGKFAEISKLEKSGSRGGPGRSGGDSPPRLPPEKTDLIGYLGECVVFHWLTARFPSKDIESCWQSKNKSRLYPCIGDDNLGYDFKVEYDRKIWFLEVKGSLQDPKMFEMGESEVEKAKEVAVSKKGEYTIIYVCNLEEPNRMRLLVLPNPFSDEGKKVFGPPKEKFRYKFAD